MCRCPLLFNRGHSISSRKAYAVDNPPPITAETIPAKCAECRLRPINEYWRVKISELKENISAYQERNYQNTQKLLELTSNFHNSSNLDLLGDDNLAHRICLEEIRVIQLGDILLNQNVTKAKEDCKADVARLRLRLRVKGTWAAVK